MVYKVIGRSNKCWGYLINEKVFPQEVVSSLVAKFRNLDVINGKRKGKGIECLGTWYPYCRLDSLADLRLLKDEDIILNKLSFVNRQPSSSELLELSGYWKHFVFLSKFVYTIFDDNLDVLGFFITDKDIYKSDNCYLAMIEILNRGCGTGTLVVSKLLEFTSIHGISCISSIKFWEKMGANFFENNRFEIMSNMQYKE